MSELISSPTVLCLGILVADVIGRPIDAVPARGALQLVESITPHIGGCAANTGIGLQTLGIPTRVAGKVGRDGFGGFIRTELEKFDVQSAGVVEDAHAPTSATMVLVESSAERAFLHCTGANATYELADIDDALFEDVALLHIAGHGLMPRLDGEQCAQLLGKARERGIKTCLDTAGAPDEDWTEKLRATLPHLDYFVPSLHEVRHFVPAAQRDNPQAIADYFLQCGVGVVALKMGERGSFVTDGRESYLAPLLPVKAIDATGAGDAFAAGFLCGVLRGLDLKACARLGNAAGALCVTRVGTVAGYRSYEETVRFIETHEQQRSESTTEFERI
ncbi:MAG TPA: carbohydrate kinase family protein [Abditibacteriaceae bacterium]|jgi:sugar/nucleoside kinase (ribokinase family)